MEIKCQLNDGNQSNVLVIEASYQKGGINYATYKNEKRGIYCYVRPEKQEGNSRSFMMFSGGSYKFLLSEEARLNRKKLDAVKAKIDALNGDELLAMYVAGKNDELVAKVKQAVGVQ